MSNAQVIERIAAATPRLRTKFVVGYYLLTIATSLFILFSHGRATFTADLLAAIFYLAVTAVLYDLSRGKHKSLPLLAALLNLAVLLLGKFNFLPHGRTAHRAAARGA